MNAVNNSTKHIVKVIYMNPNYVTFADSNGKLWTLRTATFSTTYTMGQS